VATAITIAVSHLYMHNIHKGLTINQSIALIIAIHHPLKKPIKPIPTISKELGG